MFNNDEVIFIKNIFFTIVPPQSESVFFASFRSISGSGGEKEEVKKEKEKEEEREVQVHASPGSGSRTEVTHQKLLAQRARRLAFTRVLQATPNAAVLPPIWTLLVAVVAVVVQALLVRYYHHHCHHHLHRQPRRSGR